MTTGTKTEEEEYGLHIRLSKGLQPQLKDMAELAQKLEIIPKADLVDLMNIFIIWGFTILKQKWLDRMGYH